MRLKLNDFDDTSPTFDALVASLPLPTAAYKNVSPAVSQPLPSGFTTLPSSGWFSVLFRSTDTAYATSQALFSLHSGNTTHTFGARIEVTTGKIGSYMRQTSSPITGFQSTGKYVANSIGCFTVTWNISGGNITYRWFWDGEFYEVTRAYTAYAGNFTLLNVGARNGGLDPITGAVQYAEIGSGTFLTLEQCAALARRTYHASIVVSAGGQSNVANLFTSEVTGTPVGREAFLNGVAFRDSVHTQFLPTARGGSSVLVSSAPSPTDNYWWDDIVDAPGPNLLNWVNYHRRACVASSILLWDQGEADSHRIGQAGYPAVTKATYKANLLKVFNYMRSQVPGLGIHIVNLGIRTGGYSNSANEGIQSIVDVQNEIIQENHWANFAYSRHDLALHTDGVHYTDASYATMGTRGAAAISRDLGAAPNIGGGPQLISATRSASTVTATIRHDQGTDFTPTTGIEGFAFVQDSDKAVFVPTSVVRASATTLTITLPSSPASAGRLYYMYDNPTITSLANVLKGNGTGTPPLRRGFVTCN